MIMKMIMIVIVTGKYVLFHCDGVLMMVLRVCVSVCLFVTGSSV